MKSTFSKTLRCAIMSSAAIMGVSFAIAWNADQVRAAAAGNMRTFMIGTVMPGTQSLWDGSYADKLTDADWTNMQRGAATLQAAMATIASGGSVPAEQTRAKLPVWQDWTKKMGEAVIAAKAAADKKDQMGVATAGDNLVEICEGCHMAFDPTAR
jgi:cytochrome c556